MKRQAVLIPPLVAVAACSGDSAPIQSGMWETTTRFSSAAQEPLWTDTLTRCLFDTVAADPADLRARHLLGAHRLVAGRNEEALEQFLEMLRIDRNHADGLPRKALIDAFRVIDDAGLVGRYRRRMASLLLV